jgi:hypothetical protein
MVHISIYHYIKELMHIGILHLSFAIYFQLIRLYNTIAFISRKYQKNYSHMEFFDKILHIQIWKHDEQYSMIFHINCSSMWRFIDIEMCIFGSTLKWYKYIYFCEFFCWGSFV